VTGCGCLGLIALIVGLLVVFIRGSFDAGEPIDTAVALVVVLSAGLAVQRWQRERSANELVRARRA
jgi:hypothetical protein